MIEPEPTGPEGPPEETTHNPPPSRASTSTPRRRIVLAIGLVLLLLPILLAAMEPVRARLVEGAVDLVDRPAGASTETVLVVVERGASAAEIAERLQERGLIGNAHVFRLLSEYYGVSRRLEAGPYALSPSMTASEILSRLNRGLVRSTWFTVPEGWRLEEIAQALETNGIFPAAEFRRAAEDRYDFPFLPARAEPGRLEGYLFPDTYNVHPGETPSDLIRRMLADFDRRVSALTRSRAWPDGLTLHQALTLASIVEREAVLAEERSIIAGVFLNRLRIGMRLDADPTLQYAVAPRPSDDQPTLFWKNGLTAADKQSPSPYNTYRYTGLPPGPICNPGLASIQAVLEPVPSDYLFFVAKGDGSHAFANTYAEHLENVARYQ